MFLLDVVGKGSSSVVVRSMVVSFLRERGEWVC